MGKKESKYLKICNYCGKGCWVKDYEAEKVDTERLRYKCTNCGRKRSIPK